MRRSSPIPARPSRVCATIAASLLTSWSAAAWAQDLEITTDQPLGGDLVYQQVTIDAEIDVPTYDPDEPDTGWLRIYADRILIGDGGSINADGAGFNAADPGPGLGGFAPPANDDQPAPGGGGAHVGAGAQGAWGEAPMSCPPQNGSLCQAYGPAAGGIPYEDPMNPLALFMGPTAGMGSAGGRSWAGCPNNDSNLPGGAGGGTIVLVANQIDLRGALLARGVTPGAGALTSPGGGAGGTVILSVTGSLSVGGAAQIRVDGADGQVGNAVGGGGGGGLIVLATTTDVTTLLGTDCPAAGACTSVAGGATGTCGEVAEAGARLSRSPLACPDADGDGFANSGCLDPQATDCNDADPSVNPDADEICDGVDNDCDGGIDENPDDLCQASLTCVAGECEPGDTGAGGSLPSPAPPRIELSGGLCAVGSPLGSLVSGRSRALWIASSSALALLGLLMRRRRRRAPR